MTSKDHLVYVVPIVDVNWLTFAPFDPGRGFRVDPPDVPQSLVDLRALLPVLVGKTDGKGVLTPHSGTYCRSGYYEGEILDLYKEAVACGAELAVHLHEEIKGEGTRFGDREHVAAMFGDCYNRLSEAGIRAVAYRGGHYAYAPFMNDILIEHEIDADYSCCPGMNFPDREAIWTEAPMSADFLPADPRAPWEGQPRGDIVEVPMGSDGEGAAYGNILHVEMSEIDNLMRIWNVVLERARKTGTPQVVQCLFHTASVGRPEWLDRYKQFLDLVPERQGQFASSEEAVALTRQFRR